MILYLSQLYVYSGVYNWTRWGPLMNLRNMILNIALNLPWCDVLFCLSTLKRLLNLVLKVGLIHFCCFLSLKAEIFLNNIFVHIWDQAFDIFVWKRRDLCTWCCGCKLLQGPKKTCLIFGQVSWGIKLGFFSFPLI